MLPIALEEEPLVAGKGQNKLFWASGNSYLQCIPLLKKKNDRFISFFSPNSQLFLGASFKMPEKKLTISHG